MKLRRIFLLVFLINLLLYFNIFSKGKSDIKITNKDGLSKIIKLDEGDVSIITFSDKDTDQPQIRISKSNYIVKFNEKPIIKYKKESRKINNDTIDRINLQHDNFKRDVLQYENDFRMSKGKKDIELKHVIKREYKNVFNGCAVKVSKEIIERIKKLSYVEAVYEDVEVQADLTESVPLIGADQVWNNFGFTGTGMVISIIDTGIDYHHPDFGGNANFPSDKIIGGFDFVNDDNDPMDDNGHGTHVAGIVAADGSVVKGVAYDAKLFTFKVLNDFGNGNSSDIIAAIDRMGVDHYALRSESTIGESRGADGAGNRTQGSEYRVSVDRRHGLAGSCLLRSLVS